MRRKTVFVNEGFYHVFNRGTRKSKIFLDDRDYWRWSELLYWCNNYNYSYSVFRQQVKRAKETKKTSFQEIVKDLSKTKKYKASLVDIISYAHMPNHFHLVLRQNIDNGITRFMHKILISYSKYFNRRYDLSGSLYESIYKAVAIKSDSQFLEVNRYVHVNPLAGGLVGKGELVDYPWTSFRAYVAGKKDKVINGSYLLEMFDGDREELRKFTLAKIDEESAKELSGVSIDDDFGWFIEREEEKKRRREEALCILSQG